MGPPSLWEGQREGPVPGIPVTVLSQEKWPLKEPHPIYRLGQRSVADPGSGPPRVPYWGQTGLTGAGEGSGSEMGLLLVQQNNQLPWHR